MQSVKSPSEADFDDEPDVFDILNDCANDNPGLGKDDDFKTAVDDCFESCHPDYFY